MGERTDRVHGHGAVPTARRTVDEPPQQQRIKASKMSYSRIEHDVDWLSAPVRTLLTRKDDTSQIGFLTSSRRLNFVQNGSNLNDVLTRRLLPRAYLACRHARIVAGCPLFNGSLDVPWT